MRFMIGPHHYSNMFLIYNQFFNRAHVDQFLSHEVVAIHLGIFKEL